MNDAHIHLVVNHVPVVALPFAAVLLLYSFFVKHAEVRRVALLAVIAAGLTALPALLTGEPAEEQVEDLAGFDRHMIHEHEEAAELATWTACITAVLGAGALLASRLKPRTAMPLFYLALGGAVVASGLMMRAANLGGVLRHSEIRDELPSKS